MWHNWILVNLDGRAPPLEEFVAPMADYYRDVAFSRARHFSTVFRHPFSANWKTVTENNIEPYHVPMVHPGTSAGHPFDCHRIVDEGPLVGCAVDIEGSTFTNRPPPQTADHLDGSGRFILRVPNLYIAAHAPDKLVDSLILPDWDDPMKCWVSHACYTTSEPGASDDALGRWAAIQETVMEEDAAVMEGVVRGFRAPVMDDGGVISPAWEKCVSGFYRSLLGRWRTRSSSEGRRPISPPNPAHQRFRVEVYLPPAVPGRHTCLASNGIPQTRRPARAVPWPGASRNPTRATTEKCFGSRPGAGYRRSSPARRSCRSRPLSG